MNADRTVNERIARYRQRMTEKGMVVVRVWVPTQADADKIKQLAAEMRQQAASDSDAET